MQIKKEIARVIKKLLKEYPKEFFLIKE